MFLSVEGEKLNNSIFDSVVPFQYDYNPVAKVKKEGKWGLIDTGGRYMIPAKFDSLELINARNKNYYLTIKRTDNGTPQWGIFHKNGKEIISNSYHKVTYLEKHSYLNNFYSFEGFLVDSLTKDNQLYTGLYNPDGKQLLACEFVGFFPIYYDYKSDLDLCYEVRKKNPNREKIGNYIMNAYTIGAYNLTEQKWIFPCTYSVNQDKNQYGSFLSFESKNSFVPVINEAFLSIDDDYFSISGKYLFNSKIFNPLIDSKSYYFVAGDSIIAKTTFPGKSKLSDSLNRYALNINGGLAIYDFDKGFILDTGLYLFDNNNLPKRSFFYAISKRDRKVIPLNFEGNIIPTSDSKCQGRFPLENQINDDEGNLIDFCPYTILSKIEIPEKNLTYLIAHVNGFYGILNTKKEILLPFEYRRLSYNNEYGVFIASLDRQHIIYDDRLKKIKSFQGAMSIHEDAYSSERFIQLWYKNKIDIYDLKEKTYLLRKKFISAEDREKIDDYEGYDGVLPFITKKDSLTFFQIFESKNGWVIYNEKGKLIQKAPIHSLGPMNPIIIEGKFGGIVYPTEYEGYNINRAKKYIIFNGVKFEGIIDVRWIAYIDDYSLFWITEPEGCTSIFNADGTLHIKYCEEVPYYKDNLMLVRLNENDETFCLLDEKYEPLICEIKEFIGLWEGEKSIYKGFVKKGKEYYFFSLNDRVIGQKAYNKISPYRYLGITLCHYDSDKIDLLDNNGNTLFPACTYVNVQSTYIVLNSNGFQYWLTKDLQVYAKHKLE